MKDKDMLHYLDAKLSQTLGDDFEVAIDWDTKNHTIELILRLFAENPTGAEIEDTDGVLSEEEVIEFEDGILLYDPQKSIFEADDFLAVLPYQGKKGLLQGVIDALCIYVREILTEGSSDLLDFLNDDEAEEFALVWDEQQFDITVKEQLQKNDGTIYLPYPKY